MTSEIVAFVKARLDDDERVAREATPGPWAWRPWVGAAKLALVADEGVVLLAAVADSYPSRFDAEHITRHDPARVLRDVEAKRAILADYERYAAERRRAMNGWWEGDRDPSPILLALALPYSDHPDYREGWLRVDR